MMMDRSELGRRNSIPIIHTSGTYYEVGFDVGRTFRGLIQDYLAQHEELHEVLLPACETKEGKELYDSTIEILQKNFPHYLRELQGTADGARVPFHQLMVLHIEAVLCHLVGAELVALHYGCSTAISNYSGQVLIGHTEDAPIAMLNYVYLVSATIKEEEPQGRWKTTEEKFTAFCYAGHLPGFCMGSNAYGLVYTINVLWPEKALFRNTPEHFLMRALLSASSFDEATEILEDTGVGVANGFSLNITFNKNKKTDFTLYNIEVGPNYKEPKSRISVFPIKSGEHLVHMNWYQHLEIPQIKNYLPDLDIRNKSLAKKDPPLNFSAIINILSDGETQCPFFWEGNESQAIATVSFALFNIEEKTWSIWMKNPKHHHPLFILPLEY